MEEGNDEDEEFGWEGEEGVVVFVGGFGVECDLFGESVARSYWGGQSRRTQLGILIKIMAPLLSFAH